MTVTLCPKRSTGNFLDPGSPTSGKEDQCAPLVKIYVKREKDADQNNDEEITQP